MSRCTFSLPFFVQETTFFEEFMGAYEIYGDTED